VSKTYESDVRFERCYALDWKGQVDPGIRTRCWEEWLAHFAEGQTRDRIEHARMQVKGGGAGAHIGATGSAEQPIAARALPEPTSVFSPVPMMASPNASSQASAGVTASASAEPAVRSGCETRCDKALEGCLSGCASAICEQFCAQRHGKCTPKCTASR
jgi:hypothetical protein